MVVGNKNGFGTQLIAFMGAGDEHDAIGDTEGEVAAVVHQGGNGEVGKGKESTTLADMTAIQVLGCDGHLGNGMLGIDLGNLATCIGSEAVCAIQKILNRHGIVCHDSFYFLGIAAATLDELGRHGFPLAELAHVVFKLGACFGPFDAGLVIDADEIVEE